MPGGGRGGAEEQEVAGDNQEVQAAGWPSGSAGAVPPPQGRAASSAQAVPYEVLMALYLP